MSVTAVVVACGYEFKPLKKQMSGISTREVGGKVYYCGKLEEKDVVLVQSGVGRTNAAATTAVLCVLFKAQLVINSGAAGGISRTLKIGDIIVAEKLVYGDVDNCCFGLQFGQVPYDSPAFYTAEEILHKFQTVCQQMVAEQPVGIHRGLVVTVESFCESEETKQGLLKHWPEAMAVEMEGCAVAHVCQQFKVPCLIVRSVSDTADDHAEYDSFASLAGERSAQMTRAFLKQI
ncbi:5'-methylthioadenosine/S-adenosylhomocysteine nucleosidase [Gregarina niphandrodes]|uniref:adenosylhomocysteine nucleosidase n=1 Tax=Gregarina niphandrodes TaxID=110365 RepID=A0A023BBJ3_GRENI|nr:5'-methylthioadenosine/S-adenosylhomocysteine nucleosidase [Gregarina niphandrodes]EZG79923.1 5'-methylthioadenosine/S-adenosylhomocysteine nucleosidase [Gregarina niphandrodes]|eukprot:XP_011134368.1 5'-methylthioadenosine/S-adenosylhomocysteine nucleosidase [Gregarina niphandrodes]